MKNCKQCVRFTDKKFGNNGITKCYPFARCSDLTQARFCKNFLKRSAKGTASMFIDKETI